MTSSLAIGKLIFKTEKARDRFIKKYSEIIGRYGYNATDIEKEIQELTKKFGKEASFSDAIWSLFNQSVLKIAQKAPVDLEKLSYLHFDMSLFLAESGEDPSATLEEAHRYRLMDFNHRWTKVRVSSPSFGCEHCQKLSDKVFTINEALQNKVLPNKKCSSLHFKTSKYPWCTCYFVAVP